MRYFATRLDVDKPLIYKINSNNRILWYSYHQKRWFTENENVSLNNMREYTKEQMESFLYMRELVS